jgi:hypothetical protein
LAALASCADPPDYPSAAEEAFDAFRFEIDIESISTQEEDFGRSWDITFSEVLRESDIVAPAEAQRLETAGSLISYSMPSDTLDDCSVLIRPADIRAERSARNSVSVFCQAAHE